MTLSRIAAAASATALVAAIALAATPASAATLPEDDGLYVVTAIEGTATLVDVDAATAAGAAVGAGSAVSDITQWGGAFDPESGLGYFLAGGGESTLLYSVDPATGTSTLVGTMQTGDSSPYLVELAIGASGAFAVPEGSGALYAVDLATGALTDTGFTVPHAHGLAADPTTGVYYLWNWDTQTLATVDVTDGTITSVGATPGISSMWSMEIDSDGAFWALLEGDGWRLASFTLDDLTGVVSGSLTAGDASFLNPALFITTTPVPVPPAPPAPGLAASGGADPTGMIAVAALLLSAGLLVVGTRRLRAAG